MRTHLICHECAQNSGGIGSYFVETIRDDGLYTGKCPNGHELLIGTQTLRYEMLFEIALNAIKDGYYREAVSSFSASAERYFEFSIRVLARQSEIPPDIFEKSWKLISKQSERQLGAFIILYTTKFKNLPNITNEKMTNFRNKVIHQGVLPNKIETIEFGSHIYEIIQSGVQKLRNSFLKGINEEIQAHNSTIANKMGSRYPRSFQATPTQLNIIEDISSGYKSFDEILKSVGAI